MMIKASPDELYDILARDYLPGFPDEWTQVRAGGSAIWLPHPDTPSFAADDWVMIQPKDAYVFYTGIDRKRHSVIISIE